MVLIHEGDRLAKILNVTDHRARQIRLAYERMKEFIPRLAG